MRSIYKVVQQGEVFAVQSQKAESGQVKKCQIVLSLLGGNYEDKFVCTMLGDSALCRLSPDDLVAASLRFTMREYNGALYQDVLVTEIRKLSTN